MQQKKNHGSDKNSSHSLSGTKKTTRLNFVLQLIVNGLTKLADSLVDVKTVLPWLMSALSVPVWIISLLVPLRESGSLLPQLWIAPWIKRFKQRKWIWVIGSLGQAASVALIVVSAFLLKGYWAGIAIITAIILFSWFRSLCSITSKDIMGRTIPKMSRGKLGGWSTSVAGIVTLLIGLFITLSASGEQYTLYLLAFGVVVWIIASLVYTGIRENVEEGAGESSVESIPLRLLIKDDQFRYFVIIRTLLLSTALSAPFYTLLIQQYHPENQQLGFLLIASSLAGIVSGPLWGRMADWSSRRVLIISALISGLFGLAILGYTLFAETVSLLVLLAGFFIALVAHQGVRLGRKTYVLDMASGDKRTDYVAISNTFIWAMLLICAAIGLLVDNSSAISAIAFLATLSLLVSVLALKLSEVESLAEKNIKNDSEKTK